MTTVKTECDSCGANVATTTNCEGWYIQLSSEPQKVVGPTVTCVADMPYFPKPLHFCGINCFTKWASLNL